MSEDFVRYYIGDMHFEMLRNIQQESGKFSEWELIRSSDFDLKKSYGYKRNTCEHDKLMLEAITQRSIIAETRQLESVGKSKLWSDASNIADVLTLLSIARARYYSAFAIETNKGNNYGIGWGLITRDIEGNWDIVSISNLGNFVSEALTFIKNNPNWLEESGLIPSIYWFTQAQISFNTSPSILEIGLYWVSMETIAGIHNEANSLGITYKKEIVKRFISDRGYSGGVWSFLDEVIDDWYKIRNNLFHKGKEEGTIALLSRRRQQVRDFTSLVFVEMLQNQGEERRKKIAKRIANY